VPDPSTPRISLYKSKSDGSELVTYTQDIAQNWDKVDLAVGYQVVTSSTRPATPYAGKPITQSDTAYSTFFSNGTAPASASWVEIPNGSASFNSTLRLASGKQININASGSGASIAVVNAAATTDLLSARVSGDTQDRFLVDTDGTLNWGPGNAVTDVNLYRSAANTLRTADNLTVDLNLLVSGTASITSDLTVGDTTWTPYTPTVGNQGTATWATRVGWYKKIGKIVIFEIYLAASGAGSGTTNLTLTTPSTPYRDGNGANTTRQHLPGYCAAVTAGTNSSVSGTFNGVVLAGGSGAVVDQLRGPTDIPMRGEQISSTSIITFQGWYREA
jgi:hypothetical protein